MSAGETSARAPDQQVFAPAVAAALVVVGALSVLFYVVFAAYAPDVSGENDGRANALSRSAVGFAGLAEFLRELDVPVLISRGLSPGEFAKASLIILAPSTGDTKTEILAVTDKEPKLIVLPKWIVARDELRAGWVRKVRQYDESDIEKSLLSSLAPESGLGHRTDTAPVHLRNGLNATDSTTGPIDSLQTIEGPNLVGYITMEEGPAVVSRVADSQIYVLSDPDLLNTHGLHDLDTARTAASIIQSLRANDGPVILDVTLNGYRRSPNFLRLIFEPPLLGATLCALFAALLLGVRAAVRFGAADESGRAFAFGKQALADNSAALIAMAHREHRIVLRYAAAMRRRVARAVGVPVDEREDSLNALLDRLHPRNDSGQSLSAIFAEATAAQNERDALRAARRLHRWRGEMMHER
jgi:hypothetical protein